jgi:putative YhbY family RNA-binding protein
MKSTLKSAKSALSPAERKALKAQAHALDPVVLIGEQGLTPAVLKEIDRSLKAHELIKVRASTDERDVRETWFAQICQLLGAEYLQHIGKTLIAYRLNPEKEQARRRKAAPAPAPTRKRSNPGRAPEAPRARRRSTRD